MGILSNIGLGVEPEPGPRLMQRSKMNAAELMTRNVVTVHEDASISEAVRVMLKNGNQRSSRRSFRWQTRGIVTEGDFLRRSELGTERHRPRWLAFLLGSGRLAAEYVHTHARQVAEVMTSEVQVISEDTPVGEIPCHIMEQRRVKRLPVLRDGGVVGIVSRADLLHVLAAFADEVPATSASDAGIRAHLMAEIAKQPWAPRATVNVIVRNGVVYLSGMTFDDRERRALRVLAENAPGAKNVKDGLRVMEPLSGLLIDEGTEDNHQ